MPSGAYYNAYFRILKDLLPQVAISRKIGALSNFSAAQFNIETRDFKMGMGCSEVTVSLEMTADCGPNR
jgi:hypothetical protein